jgi:hypothetical protein
MRGAALIRWSGLASILGGVLWAALGWLTTFAAEQPILGLTERGYTRLLPVPLMLLLAGLIGLQARHARRSGWLGWAGFVLTCVGLILLLVGTVIEGWGEPVRGVALALLGSVVSGLGLVLVGIATSRRRVLPVGISGIPLVLGLLSPSQYLALGIGSLLVGQGPGLVLWGLFGLGWTVLGYALWSDSRVRQGTADDP